MKAVLTLPLLWWLRLTAHWIGLRSLIKSNLCWFAWISNFWRERHRAMWFVGKLWLQGSIATNRGAFSCNVISQRNMCSPVDSGCCRCDAAAVWSVISPHASQTVIADGCFTSALYTCQGHIVSLVEAISYHDFFSKWWPFSWLLCSGERRWDKQIHTLPTALLGRPKNKDVSHQTQQLSVSCTLTKNVCSYR